MALNGVCALPELIYSLTLSLPRSTPLSDSSRPSCLYARRGGTQMLPRLVGTGKALEMLMLGEYITAQERIG